LFCHPLAPTESCRTRCGSRLRYSAGGHSRHTAFRAIKAMGVDPQVKEFLAKQNQSTVSYDTLTPEEARSSAVKLLK